MTCDISRRLSLAALLGALGAVACAADPVAEALAGNMLPADAAMTSYTGVLNAIERADADADDAWRRLGSRKEYDACRAEMIRHIMAVDAVLNKKK